VKYSINIIGGSHFTVEDKNLYNVSYLFRRDGTLAHQYKLTISPKEHHWWGITPGHRIEVFDTDRGKISIQIGSDIQFPEIAQKAVARGAQIIFVPFSTEERYANLRISYCARARAIENHVYVATSGAVGNRPLVRHLNVHYAQSGIYTPSDLSFPKDAVAAECEPNIETVIIKDLDLKLLTKLRAARNITHFQPSGHHQR
jgi:predicted amidohydrolase